MTATGPGQPSATSAATEPSATVTRFAPWDPTTVNSACFGDLPQDRCRVPVDQFHGDRQAGFARRSTAAVSASTPQPFFAQICQQVRRSKGCIRKTRQAAGDRQRPGQGRRADGPPRRPPIGPRPGRIPNRQSRQSPAGGPPSMPGNDRAGAQSRRTPSGCGVPTLAPSPLVAADSGYSSSGLPRCADMCVWTFTLPLNRAVDQGPTTPRALHSTRGGRSRDRYRDLVTFGPFGRSTRG